MSRRAARTAPPARATPDHPPPRLWLDAVGAALLLCAIAFFARTTLTPDGVAYFENAELFARGRWSEAIQGYWSPGYSLLLVPVVWATGDDRVLFLTIAHVVQALLGIVTLQLAMRAVQARVPRPVQRAVYWGCAWVILRWLTQELLTPDLLLCVLLLLFVVRLPARNRRDQLALGLIAGAGFLVKTSIWPWLVVAVAVAALGALRAGDWRTFPLTTVAAGALIAGTFTLVLSLRAGHPTLGSVGPLNARWYLGNLDRRTPDTDRGPHKTKTTLRLPNGDAVPMHDLRQSTRTYLPWSDPERWSAGVPVVVAQPFSAAQATASWRLNGLIALRWLLPTLIGLALLVGLCGIEAEPGARWTRLLDRPLIMVGLLNALIFIAVHAESRLLAPAALQCLLGVWPIGRRQWPHPRLSWAALASMAGVAIQLAIYAAPLPRTLMKNSANEGERHRYLVEQRVRNPKQGAIIIGPAVVWMGALWQNHMRVALQIGGEGRTAVKALTEAQRLQWLYDQFSGEVLGVGEAVVSRRGGTLHTDWTFVTW